MRPVTLYGRIKTGVFLSIITIFTCSTAVGQEYKYEIGGMAGMSMYMGDVNKNNLFLDWNPAFGAVFRANLNLRWAIKANLLTGSVSGDTRNTDNVFPDHAQLAFKRRFYELGAQAEFNFLPYSDKYAYLQTSRISPYAFAGLGYTLATGDETFSGMNVPVGIGVKYKMKHRLNLGLEYSFRKLFADDFDAPSKKGFNLDDSYNIPGSRLKNKDWYSLLMITVTWDFGLNGRKCTNL